jgi:hypothetical protein
MWNGYNWTQRRSVVLMVLDLGSSIQHLMKWLVRASRLPAGGRHTLRAWQIIGMFEDKILLKICKCCNSVTHTALFDIFFHPFPRTVSGEHGLCSGNIILHGEISGSHGGECEDNCLLRCCFVLSGRRLPMFQRCFLPPSSGQWWRQTTLCCLTPPSAFSVYWNTSTNFKVKIVINVLAPVWPR